MLRALRADPPLCAAHLRAHKKCSYRDTSKKTHLNKHNVNKLELT